MISNIFLECLQDLHEMTHATDSDQYLVEYIWVWIINHKGGMFVLAKLVFMYLKIKLGRLFS